MQPSQLTPSARQPLSAYLDLPYSYPYQSPSIAAAAGRSDQIQTMDSDADFYLCRALFTGITSPSTIELRDHYGDAFWSQPVVGNTPVDFTFQPARRIPASGRIQMGFTNNSGAAITPRVRLEGFKRYRFTEEQPMNRPFWPSPAQLGDLMPTDTPAGYEDRFYIQVLPPTSILAGAANVQYNIAVQTGVEGDFIWRTLAYTGDTAGGLDPGLVAIRWQDADRYYRSNSRIPVVLVGGPIQNPAPIFPEIVIPPRGQILFELENLNAGTQTNFQLLLGGVMRRRLAQ